MRLIVSGGGTGGHIYPGIAVAEAIISSIPESRVLFIGTAREAEKRAFSGGKFESATLTCHGLKGKTPWARLKACAYLPLSLIRSLMMVREFKPDLVLGVGGYVTGPVMLAARLLGKSTCIHEQNSVPGLANRIIGRFVHRVFITYPDSEDFFPAGKCVVTGNPVRREIAAIESHAVRERLPGEGAGEACCLGILGGSLGAHRINTLMTGLLSGLKDKLPENFQVLHQTGAADEDMVREAYGAAGIKALVSDFFEDMAEFYRHVDLVVSRAGATSLAEITVVGIPSILIPYPYAADNHQRKNAEFMVRGGAAAMFLEGDLAEDELAGAILRLLTDSRERLKMAKAAEALSRPDALGAIVEECRRMVKS